MKKLINRVVLFVINKYTNKILIDKEAYCSLGSEICDLRAQIESLSKNSALILEQQLDALGKINQDLKLKLEKSEGLRVDYLQTIMELENPYLGMEDDDFNDHPDCYFDPRD